MDKKKILIGHNEPSGSLVVKRLLSEDYIALCSRYNAADN